MNRILFILTLCLSAGLIFAIKHKVNTRTQPPIPYYQYPPFQEPPVSPDPPFNIGPQPEPPIQTPEPEWTSYPAQRTITNLGKVLSDIEGHMPAGHIYRDSDKITWAHETSHGIHSHLRQKFNNGRRINGFYLLNDRACIVEEPKTTIQAAARIVPSSLRGGVYNLYMIQQAGSWGDTPLYVFDEWVAYANGSACRLDLQIQSRNETVLYMLEFNVYATCVAHASGSQDPQFKKFLMWHIERCMNLYKDSKNLGNSSKHDAYLEKMRTASDAREWRENTKQYFGSDWTLRVLGF